MRTKQLVGLVVLGIVGLVLPAVAPAEDGDGDGRLHAAAVVFGRALEAVIEDHYPDAEEMGVFLVTGERIHAERRARTFLVHHADKTGRWQDAVEARGPEAGGFVLLAEVGRGSDPSARASGPYDVRYYVDHRMRAEDLASGLHVRLDLRLPPERANAAGRPLPRVPAGFEDAIRGVVARFGRIVREGR